MIKTNFIKNISIYLPILEFFLVGSPVSLEIFEKAVKMLISYLKNPNINLKNKQDIVKITKAFILKHEN
jgi:hypothetical protein